jgi:hypothetical protein
MEPLSRVEAPGSARLVKVLTLVVGVLSILGGVSGEGGAVLAAFAVVFGLCCVVTAVRIKHGHGRRIEVTALMAIAALAVLGEVLFDGRLLSLFGLLIPVGVALWANVGTGRAWFDSRA